MKLKRKHNTAQDCIIDIKSLSILTYTPDILSSKKPRSVLSSSTGSGKTLLAPIIFYIISLFDSFRIYGSLSTMSREWDEH